MRFTLLFGIAASVTLGGCSGLAPQKRPKSDAPVVIKENPRLSDRERASRWQRDEDAALSRTEVYGNVTR